MTISSSLNFGVSSLEGRGNTIMSRDADGNTVVNSIAIGTTSTASSGGTINLYIGSAQAQILTGITTETFVLPDATTLTNGWTYLFNNNSTGIMTVQLFGGGTFISVYPGSYAEVFLTDDSTSTGVWDYHWSLPTNSKYDKFGLLIDGFIGTSPPSSHLATALFGSSITAGTATQNILGYNVLVNIVVNFTAATSATITMGVDSSSTPTVNTVIPSFTQAAGTYTFSAIVPNLYYLLVDTTGTITISSITTQVCPL